MEIFIEWISVIGAICFGVMALALFFTLLGAVKRRFSRNPIVKLKGLLDTSKLMNVHVSGGKVVSHVRFVGFTDPNSMKEIPYHLNNMVVFETAAKKRILLRADVIRMIEEVEDDDAKQTA